jgi:hypothetical protein
MTRTANAMSNPIMIGARSTSAANQEAKRTALRATNYHSRPKAFANQLGVGFGSLPPYMRLTEFRYSLAFSADRIWSCPGVVRECSRLCIFRNRTGNARAYRRLN